MWNWRTALVILPIAGLLVGCAGAPKRGAPVPAAAARAGDDAWSRSSWEERHDLMTFTVLPNMARLFQEYRRSAAPDLTCRSCHGADAEAVSYRMPHGLPALDRRHMPAPGGSSELARKAKFMQQAVVPEMAELLGVEPFDRRTGRGFGCFNCHPAKAGSSG